MSCAAKKFVYLFLCVTIALKNAAIVALILLILFVSYSFKESGLARGCFVGASFISHTFSEINRLYFFVLSRWQPNYSKVWFIISILELYAVYIYLPHDSKHNTYSMPNLNWRISHCTILSDLVFFLLYQTNMFIA